MSEEPRSSFPKWMLAPAIGLAAGLAIGAVVIFGSKPESGTTSDAPTASANTAGDIPSASGAAPASSSATNVPADTASLEAWNAEISTTSVEELNTLMPRALSIADEGRRQAVIQAIVVRWLDGNQDSFLDYLDDLEFSDTEGREVWPSLVPAFVEALPNISEQAAGAPQLDEIVQWVLEYYAEIDPAKALTWSKEWLLGESQESAMATIAGEMATRSPDEAYKLLAEIKSPEARLDAVENIASALGTGTPAAALAWAQALPDENERALAVEEVLWTMSETNPEEAARQLAQTQGISDVEGVSGSIAEEWALRDHTKAITWAESLPEGGSRQEALQGALAGWAESDPEAAFQYYQSKHAANTETAEWIFEAWAFQSPTAAAAKATSLPDPEMRGMAITGVVNGWLNEGSFDRVTQWVDALPAGRDRDQASAVLVDTLSFDEPQPAWQRALAIQEPDIRGDAIQSAFAGLVEANPQAAQAALDQATLTAEERSALAPILQALQAQGGN